MFKTRLIPVVRPTAEFVPSRHLHVDLARPDAAPAPSATMEAARAPVWGSAASRRIRFVEGAVILSLMGYFATGLAKAVGLF